MSNLGFWSDDAKRLMPEGDVILKGIKFRAYSIMRGNKVVGTMRRVGVHGWMVRIEGFTFFTAGEGSAKFGMKTTPCKLYKTSMLGRAAITNAFLLLI